MLRSLESLTLRTYSTVTEIASLPVNLRRLDIYLLGTGVFNLRLLLQLTRLTELGIAQLTREIYSFIPASLKVLYTQPKGINDIHPFFAIRDYTDWAIDNL